MGPAHPLLYMQCLINLWKTIVRPWPLKIVPSSLDIVIVAIPYIFDGSSFFVKLVLRSFARLLLLNYPLCLHY